ncbi:MAG: hypothetical protein R3Y07_05090 [Eubacteriales bacterium]
MDFHIISPLGLSEHDLVTVRNLDGVSQVRGGHSYEGMMDGEEIMAYSYHGTNSINAPHLLSGNFPKTESQCAIHPSLGSIGDVVTINVKGNTYQLTVVGTVETLFDYALSEENYVLLSDSLFNTSSYNDLYLTVEEGKSEAVLASLTKIAPTQIAERLIEATPIIQQMREEAIAVAVEKQNQVEQELEQTIAEIAQMRVDLEFEWAQFNEDAISEEIALAIKEQEAGLQLALSNLAKQEAEADARTEEARLELRQIELELDELQQSEWSILGRESDEGYAWVASDLNTLETIATNLSVPFYWLTILICAVSAMRIMKEETGRGGTLLRILLYTMMGGLLGLIGEEWLVASLIYPSAITLLKEAFYPVIIIGGGAALVMIFSKTKPLAVGKKVWLEKLRFIWEEFNIEQRVTLRNLLRYKVRSWASVLGIGGSVALMLASFGIQRGLSGGLLVASHQGAVILVYTSCMLSFGMICHLLSLNISEHREELATLKVLGCFDEELCDYVSRENKILLILGSLLGLWGGSALYEQLAIQVELIPDGVGLIAYMTVVVLLFIFWKIVDRLSFNLVAKVEIAQWLE